MGGWDIQKMQNEINEQGNEEIKKIFISENLHEDELIWSNNKKKGIYTVKSGYFIEVSTNINNNNNNNNANNNNNNDNNNSNNTHINNNENLSNDCNNNTGNNNQTRDNDTLCSQRNNGITSNNYNEHNNNNNTNNRIRGNNYNKQNNNIIRNTGNNQTYNNFPWNKMWNLNIPPKIKMFLWKACNEALLMRWNLKKRKINLDTKCPLCKEVEKTTLQGLLICPFIIVKCGMHSKSQ